MSSSKWSHRIFASLLVALGVAALPRGATAQQSAAAKLGDVATAIGLNKDSLVALARELLGDPDVMNRALSLVVGQKGHGRRLLQDAHVSFKTFSADELLSGTTGLGLSYDWTRDLARRSFVQTSGNQYGVVLTPAFTGNVAFDPKLNPRNFLDSGIRIEGYLSQGGVIAPTDTTAIFNALDSLQRVMVQIRDKSQLLNHPATRRFLEIMYSHLSTQTYFGGSGTVRLESDQKAIQKQWVYGAIAGLDIKAWNPNSQLAASNVFDWPFAAIRWLAGVDSVWRPRGSSIPSVQAELAQVNPKGDSVRTRLGEAGSYPRFKLEAAFRTPLLGSSAGRLYAEVNWRLYHEINAASAIKSAGLADMTYFAAALTSAQGPFVSYSTGRLPFDLSSDQVYELGFKLHF